jgi:hypothetical protein
MNRSHSHLVLGGVLVVLGVLMGVSGGCHFSLPSPTWNINTGTSLNGVELPYKNTLHFSSPEQVTRLKLSLDNASIVVEGDPNATGLDATFEVREHTQGDASLGPAPDSIAVKSATSNPVMVTSAKVRVPSGTIVDVSTSLGSVTITGIRGVSLVNGKTDAGRVELRNLADVTTVKAKSSLGHVALETASGCGDLTLETDSGSVSVSQVTGAKTLACSTNLGGVHAKGVEASESLTARSDCGSVEIEDVKTGRATLKSSLGSVTARRSTFDHVSAHTDSGSVRLKGCTYKSKDVGTDFGRVTDDE